MTLGEKIYTLRTEKGFSQEELSDMLGVSRQAISKWENEAATPDLDNIIRLAEIFEISIDELVRGKWVPESSKTEPEKPEIPAKAASSKAGFYVRKIIGGVLLCLSFLISFVFSVLSGSLVSGLFLASPFALCGIICLAFGKNTLLWCGWGIFFCVDMYLRFATGINWGGVFRSSVLATGNPVGLIISWAQLIILLTLITITVFRFYKKPSKSKKSVFLPAAVFLLLKIAEAVFIRTKAYRLILHELMTGFYENAVIYTLCYSLFDWLCAVFFTLGAVFIARYVYTKRKSAGG